MGENQFTANETFAFIVEKNRIYPAPNRYSGGNTCAAIEHLFYTCGIRWERGKKIYNKLFSPKNQKKTRNKIETVKRTKNSSLTLCHDSHNKFYLQHPIRSGLRPKQQNAPFRAKKKMVSVVDPSFPIPSK